MKTGNNGNRNNSGVPDSFKVTHTRTQRGEGACRGHVFLAGSAGLPVAAMSGQSSPTNGERQEGQDNPISRDVRNLPGTMWLEGCSDNRSQGPL